ncbi:wax ester synthase/diacylglycerol acyltransferase 3-like isoform X2 [Wolffia australiana]
MLLISVFEAKYTLYRMEDKTSIAGGLRVYRMPRKLATLSLSMDDMIIVKNKLNAKVNDVFAGIVTYGVEKYLRFKSPEDLLKDPVISFGSASSVRKQGAKELMNSIKEGHSIEWGNMITSLYIQMKLTSQTKDPLQYIRDVRDKFNKKKKSNEALLSFKLHHFLPVSGGMFFRTLIWNETSAFVALPRYSYRNGYTTGWLFIQLWGFQTSWVHQNPSLLRGTK